MASSRNGSGMKILWIPGRKRHDRKGIYSSTSKVIKNRSSLGPQMVLWPNLPIRRRWTRTTCRRRRIKSGRSAGTSRESWLTCKLVANWSPAPFRARHSLLIAIRVIRCKSFDKKCSWSTRRSFWLLARLARWCKSVDDAIFRCWLIFSIFF